MIRDHSSRTHRLGNTVSAAVTNRRVLAPAEARIVALIGGAFGMIAFVVFNWPLLLTGPLVVLFAWFAVALLVQAYRLHRQSSANARNDRR